MVLFIIRVNAPSFGVEAPSLEENRLGSREGVLSQQMVAVVRLRLLLHTIYNNSIIINPINNLSRPVS
jgi:hypothetical protein